MLTSEQIWSAIVEAGPNKPDDCGFSHRPAQRFFVRRREDGTVEQERLGIFCLYCGMRLEDENERV